MFNSTCPRLTATERWTNLKKNWFFPVSAMSFFCLSLQLTTGYVVSLPIAFVAAVIIAWRTPSFLTMIKGSPIALHILSLLTAVGICWHAQYSFCTVWDDSAKAQSIKALLSLSPTSIQVLSVVGAIAAVWFVYLCVLRFWQELIRIVSDSDLIVKPQMVEWLIYTLLLGASVVLVILSFSQTVAFYGAERYVDTIFTGDSSALMRDNAFLMIGHTENDIRQPLFAVFAAPFVGIPYLAGRLCGASAAAMAMLINFSQVLMLFAANFVLTRLMNLSPLKRVCFMVLSSLTFSHLLFTLMMEQYIGAYFWLIFTLYQIHRKNQPDRMLLWSAGGSLITSMVLLPFMSRKHPLKEFKCWLADMFKTGLEFVAALLVFCRFEALFYAVTKLVSFQSFTGKALTLLDKLYQYVSFVASCFIAPNAGKYTSETGHTSWQLLPVSTFNVIGLILLALVAVSIIIHRRDKSCQLALGWVVFSFVILVGLGWGTQENGLILYALYFGWAFWLLLFRLLETVESALKTKCIVPLCSIGLAAALAVINIPAIVETVKFAATYFPT